MIKVYNNGKLSLLQTLRMGLSKKRKPIKGSTYKKTRRAYARCY